MPDIFLSYTREDHATAKRVAEGLEAQGFSVWWDVTLRSGEAYDEVTEEALKTAKAVVVLWSRKSVVSRWVRAEATIADRNRTLVPARIEACDLPIMFELTQTADLSHWTGEENDRVWRAFLADVERLIKSGNASKRQTPQHLAQSGTAPPPHGARPSIAVLPFINRSGFKEDDVFANGMVEDLTGALSVSRRLKVVASSATVAYRKGAMDLRQIGRDLGVRYLLEGNVRRAGINLRVTSQLVEAETGNILWTQKFDRALADLSVLQENLVTEVAAHLGVQVERAELEHALRKPGNITAWEAVLRSDANVFRNTQSGYEAAVAEARRAVEIDPHYGAAYAALAAAQAMLLRSRDGDEPELALEALDNVRRARALDPTNPLVLCRIAGAYQGLGKPQDALPFAERAVALNPNIEILHLTLATVLMALGRSDEGLAELDAAESLAPNSSWLSVNLHARSVAHLQAGRLGQAREASDKSLRLLATPSTLIQSTLCSASLDLWERARATMRRLRDTDHGISSAFTEKYVRHYYGQLNATQADELVTILRRLWEATGGDG
jgi:TolB-like protein/Tfp pilus assembly protein PilF